MRVPASRCLNADTKESDRNDPHQGVQKTTPAAGTFVLQGSLGLNLHRSRSHFLTSAAQDPKKLPISFWSYVSEVPSCILCIHSVHHFVYIVYKMTQTISDDIKENRV
jgi:hypothetical protein